MMGDDDLRWQAYTYIAHDAVSSINDLGSRATEELSYSLNMEERSKMARFLFLTTVGQAQARFVWANSTLAHEYAHFANAHRFGRTEHYFVDYDTGEKFGWEQAWINSFFGGDPNGPATSKVGSVGLDVELDEEEGIEDSLAGLNWQMDYSEMRLREWLSGQRRTVFDITDMVFNRVYTMSYAISSHIGQSDNSWGGDPGKFVTEMEDVYGEKNVSEKLIATSVLTNIASISLMSVGTGLQKYIAHGKTEVHPYTPSFGTKHRFAWDIPHYLNKNNMSISPTLYWLPSWQIQNELGTDNLVVGAAYETSVFGVENHEFRLTLDGAWEDLALKSGGSFGPEGTFIEMQASYDISDHVTMSLGAARAIGETMRGARNLPDTDGFAWTGMQISF
jgi:hypothetical protein